MMNKTAAVAAILGLCLIAGCKKQTSSTPATVPGVSPDQTAPVITLQGKNPDTLFIGASYMEPVITATDNVDGDISYKVKIGGSVLTGTVNVYYKTYNVTDAAGNRATQITRTVNIQNQAGYLNGTYTAVCSCTTSTPTDPSNPTATVTNKTYQAIVTTHSTNNNAGTLNAYPKQTGSSITYDPIWFNAENNGVDLYFGGDTKGIIAANKKSFTVTSTQYGPNNASMITECKTVFTKN